MSGDEIIQEDTESKAAFYDEIGHGLSMFGELEGMPASIFQYSQGTEDPAPALAAFWTVSSFDLKIKMTNEAVNTIWPGDHDLRDTWKSHCVSLDESRRPPE